MYYIILLYLYYLRINKPLLLLLLLLQSDSESEMSFKTPNKLDRRTIKRKIKSQVKKTKSTGEESDSSQTSQRSQIASNKDLVSDDSAPFKMKKRRIHDSINPSITHPSGKNIRSRTSPSDINTKNKFESLNHKTAENTDMHQEPQQSKVDQPRTQTVKKIRPPPIIVHGQFEQIKMMNNLLKIKLQAPFYWNNTPNSSGLYLNTKEDWTICKDMFKEKSIEFHTYTWKDEKEHAFVLRGLHQEIEPNELKEELNENELLHVKNVYRMRGTKYPAYLVITSADITIKTIEQVKFVQHTKVRWDRHVNNKIMIQCHRCQAWGHATTNCHAVPRCLKCAASHLTKDCTKDPKLPAKCANCAGAHPANNTTCPVYQRKIQAIENNRYLRVPPAPEMKYVAAPPPKENAWTNRQQQQQHIPSTPIDFPPLSPPTTRSQRSTSARSTTPAPTLTPALATRPQQVTGAAIGIGRYAEVREEFRNLNQLIDLEDMLREVRKLTSLLAQCHTKRDKFEVFFNFMTDISDDAE